MRPELHGKKNKKNANANKSGCLLASLRLTKMSKPDQVVHSPSIFVRSNASMQINLSKPNLPLLSNPSPY